jgi:hypothetical protein
MRSWGPCAVTCVLAMSHRFRLLFQIVFRTSSEDPAFNHRQSLQSRETTSFADCEFGCELVLQDIPALECMLSVGTGSIPHVGSPGASSPQPTVTRTTRHNLTIAGKSPSAGWLYLEPVLSTMAAGKVGSLALSRVSRCPQWCRTSLCATSVSPWFDCYN